VLGVAYTLSPLTVWASAAFACLVWKIGEGLPESERRRVRAILIVAILVRVAAIAGIFFSTDHGRVPFASFFGDEEYFIRRATWLRNVALGIPIHSADLIYAFDDYSYTHYLYVIAFVEALVGFAPYGLKIISAAMYLGGAVVLFRLARHAYGSGAALSGLLVVLFLPSLFAWSIAALKEPPYFLVGALACSVAVTTMRTQSMPRRIAGVLFLVLAPTLQSIRDGGDHRRDRSRGRNAVRVAGAPAPVSTRLPWWCRSVVMFSPGGAIESDAGEEARRRYWARQHAGYLFSRSIPSSTREKLDRSMSRRHGGIVRSASV
jgi:hypothetical protein